MTWFDAYDKEHQPTFEQISAYIGNPLWEALHAYLQEAYAAVPTQSYSGCSGQPGWNVKYQKGGKSLCTLYPMEGFYIALVVVGAMQAQEMELMLPGMTPYIQTLYERAGALMGAKWLMIHVTDDAVFEDVKRIIALRRKPK